MLREAGASRSTPARCLRLPTGGRVSTGWTRAPARELLAANLTVDEIRSYLGVDSISPIWTLDRLIDAIGWRPRCGFLRSACLTGEYPVEIPEWSCPRQVLEIDERDDARTSHAIGLFDVAETELPARHARRRG